METLGRLEPMHGVELQLDSRPPPGTFSEKSCELCGGQRFQVIGRLDRCGRPLETGICVDCGLVAHMQIPTYAELDEYYARRYRRDYHGESAPSARRVMRAWKEGLRIHRQLAPSLSGHEKVFEVGAGIGCTVKVFQQGGFDASGVEPGEDFQRFGRERLGANVQNAGLFNLPGGPRYDLVLLVHVIEHFNSPTRALQAIHGLLKPNGQLYLECPNLAAPFAVRRRLFHFAHIYTFTPWTLLALAEKCGFQLQAWHSHEHDLNLQVLLRRVDHGRLRVDPEGYRRTLERIDRYNGLTYHLRSSYLLSRLKKVAAYMLEQSVAKRFVRRLCAEYAEAG